MKKLLLATVATFAFASGANALTLISADVTGPTGTIWTTRPTGNYTLFLQSPTFGTFLNPTAQQISLPVSNSGITRAFLAGEGFPSGTNLDSDLVYNLTLRFNGGQSFAGQYTPSANAFLGSGTTITEGRTTYSLSDFSYRRFRGDTVNQNVATPGGDPNDYVGNFDISAVTSAVPEPATWAMMIIGFGMVGGAMRSRAKTGARGGVQAVAA